VLTAVTLPTPTLVETIPTRKALVTNHKSSAPDGLSEAVHGVCKGDTYTRVSNPGIPLGVYDPGADDHDPPHADTGGDEADGGMFGLGGACRNRTDPGAQSPGPYTD
jgi:hypothetical protein